MSTSDLQALTISPNGSKNGSSPTSASGLKSLFEEQREFMTFFFENLEYGPIEQFCEAVMNCKGVIFFSGVGKSGFIAQKISMTLVSTGTKAVFLNPVDALHGDIGILSEEDLLVLFSKSGSTEELLKLVPYARAKGAKLVSVTSIKDSKLDRACDFACNLPLQRELCPFDEDNCKPVYDPVSGAGAALRLGGNAFGFGGVALKQSKDDPTIWTTQVSVLTRPSGAPL